MELLFIFWLSFQPNESLIIRPPHIDAWQEVKWDGTQWKATERTFDRKKAKYGILAYVAALAFDMYTTHRGIESGRDINPLANWAFKRNKAAGWAIMGSVNAFGLWQAWKHKDSKFIWAGAAYHAGAGVWNAAQEERWHD